MLVAVNVIIVVIGDIWLQTKSSLCPHIWNVCQNTRVVP